MDISNGFYLTSGLVLCQAPYLVLLLQLYSSSYFYVIFSTICFVRNLIIFLKISQKKLKNMFSLRNTIM